LLRRCSSGYELTADALAGLDELREGFARLSSAAAAMASGGQRILTVSAVPSLAAAWLVPRLHRFRQQHPGLDVLLHASDELVDLNHSKIDLGIRHGLGGFSGLTSERMFRDEIFPVYSPHLLKDRSALEKPEDLRGLPLIHTDWTHPRSYWPGWADWLRTAGVTGVDVAKGLRYSDGALVIEAAVSGQGVALGTKALALEHLAAGRLVRPFKLSLATDFAYYVVCSKARTEEPDLAAFRRWVKAEAAMKCAAAAPSLPASRDAG
jgi:LysR family glycine cleavage system transcriptional activator